MLAAGAALATLVFLELAARAAGYGGIVEFVPCEDCGFLMRPSQRVSAYGHPIAINSLGLRGPEIATPKPEGVYRILFIGDSITYGGGRIREEELFCRVVESQLQADGCNVDVVNLSAPAWSPQNWWGYVEKRGLHEADLVVLVLPECDLDRQRTDMALGGHLEHAPLLRLQSVLWKTRAALGKDGLRPSAGVKDVVAANVDAVRKLAAACKDRSFLAVLMPSEVPAKPRHRAWSAFEALVQNPLDLREELRDASLFMDGTHLNARGHAYVGAKVQSRVAKLVTSRGERN